MLGRELNWLRDSRMGLIETQAVDRAFRAGLLEGVDGRAGGAAGGLAEKGDLGKGELLVMGTRRLPGLGDPDAAFRTGRVLRLVARLFDRAKAPPIVAEQFRDNLAAAIMTHHMRRSRNGWEVADTIAMFLEMYERILEPAPEELRSAEAYMLERAVAPKRSGGGTAAAWPGLQAA